MAKITVIGTGYVGLVSGACFAEIGHHVTCVDKDPAKITQLNNNQIPIYEPGLQEIVAEQAKSGRLSFANFYDPATKPDAIFLAVGTPTDEKTGNADMSIFYAAAKEIAAALTNRPYIISKSTVPVGTGKKLAEIFGDEIDIISNPEFLREGSAVGDFMHPDRIVCGVKSKPAEDFMREIYAPLNANLYFTNIETSELIKYSSNTFLAAKVAFINEMADLCEVVGANVDELAQGMGLDKRIGAQFLKAGPGIGGSCFPKDARALVAQSKLAGMECLIGEGLVEANERHKRRMARKILQYVPSGKVAIFGLAFKANTDDMRESPSLTIIPLLQEAGLEITAYDPAAMNEAKAFLDINYAATPQEAANDADGIVILTEWPEFKELDYAALTPNKKLLIDLRNLLDKAPENYGYVGLGY